MATGGPEWADALGDPLTLRQAAGVIANVDPDLFAYARDPAKDRALVKRRSGWERRLVAAVESGELRATVVRLPLSGQDSVHARPFRGFWTSADEPAGNWARSQQTRPGMDVDASLVARADLARWCDRLGLRPAVLSTEIGSHSRSDRGVSSQRRKSMLTLMALLVALPGGGRMLRADADANVWDRLRAAGLPPPDAAEVLESDWLPLIAELARDGGATGRGKIAALQKLAESWADGARLGRTTISEFLKLALKT